MFSTLRGQKRGPDSPSTEVMSGCAVPCESWGLELNPLEEQSVPLTTESCLQLCHLKLGCADFIKWLLLLSTYRTAVSIGLW